MAIRALGIDTASDELTQICLDLRNELVYPSLDDAGIITQRLREDGATRAAVLAALVPSVRFVTGSGHGLADRLLGRTDTVLEASQLPAAAVKDKIVHLLACECGAELGADMVAKGCLAFFGYQEQFLFPLDRPMDFLSCDAVVDQQLAAGATADETYNAAVRAFRKRITELKQAGQVWRAAIVEHNLNCLCAPSLDPKWGDPNASL